MGVLFAFYDGAFRPAGIFISNKGLQMDLRKCKEKCRLSRYHRCKQRELLRIGLELDLRCWCSFSACDVLLGDEQMGFDCELQNV